MSEHFRFEDHMEEQKRLKQIAAQIADKPHEVMPERNCRRAILGAPPLQHILQHTPGTIRQRPGTYFPRFDGSNPREWMLKCERYFNITPNMADSQKVILASMYFEGKALAWYQNMAKNQIQLSWEQFLSIVSARFEDLRDAKAFRELEALKHVGSYSDYVNEFEDIIWDIPMGDELDLYEDYFTSRFIDGLSHELQLILSKMQPRSLHEAMELGQNQLQTLYRKVESKSSVEAVFSSIGAENRGCHLPLVASITLPKLLTIAGMESSYYAEQHETQAAEVDSNFKMLSIHALQMVGFCKKGSAAAVLTRGLKYRPYDRGKYATAEEVSLFVKIVVHKNNSPGLKRQRGTDEEQLKVPNHTYEKQLEGFIGGLPDEKSYCKGTKEANQIFTALEHAIVAKGATELVWIGSVHSQLSEENLTPAQQRKNCEADLTIGWSKQTELLRVLFLVQRKQNLEKSEMYLKHQSLQQRSKALSVSFGSSSRHLGPFVVVDGLNLPLEVKIRPTFNVLLWKKAVNPRANRSPSLPAISEKGDFLVVLTRISDKRVWVQKKENISQLLERVLSRRLTHSSSLPAPPLLVQKSNGDPPLALPLLFAQWSMGGVEDTIWEDEKHVQPKFSKQDPWGQGSLLPRGIVMYLILLRYSIKVAVADERLCEGAEGEGTDVDDWILEEARLKYHISIWTGLVKVGVG